MKDTNLNILMNTIQPILEDETIDTITTIGQLMGIVVVAANAAGITSLEITEAFNKIQKAYRNKLH
tara:strand:- start:1291 stop:1488 length:198 start_codon:yes stop_codon:yes gene_type:complete